MFLEGHITFKIRKQRNILEAKVRCTNAIVQVKRAYEVPHQLFLDSLEMYKQNFQCKKDKTAYFGASIVSQQG